MISEAVDKIAALLISCSVTKVTYCPNIIKMVNLK